MIRGRDGRLSHLDPTLFTIVQRFTMNADQGPKPRFSLPRNPGSASILRLAECTMVCETIRERKGTESFSDIGYIPPLLPLLRSVEKILRTTKIRLEKLLIKCGEKSE